MYEQFAQFYDRLGWNEYSKQVWVNFKEYLNTIGFKPATMLDVACGTGVLTISATKDGIMAEGLDISEEMIKKALSNASNADLNITYHHADMSNFDLGKKYDLITCTFDAMNHMTDFEQWVSLFKCVKEHLNDDNGIFMFDMNTLKGLREHWNNICIKKYPTGDYLISKSIFFGRTASVTFTAFVREDTSVFKGYEETVTQAGFPIDDIIRRLKDVGFCEIQLMNKQFEVANDHEALAKAFIVCKRTRMKA